MPPEPLGPTRAENANGVPSDSNISHEKAPIPPSHDSLDSMSMSSSPRSSTLPSWPHFPTEVFQMILGYFSRSELPTAGLVNKEWRTQWKIQARQRPQTASLQRVLESLEPITRQCVADIVKELKVVLTVEHMIEYEVDTLSCTKTTTFDILELRNLRHLSLIVVDADLLTSHWSHAQVPQSLKTLDLEITWHQLRPAEIPLLHSCTGLSALDLRVYHTAIYNNFTAEGVLVPFLSRFTRLEAVNCINMAPEERVPLSSRWWRRSQAIENMRNPVSRDWSVDFLVSVLRSDSIKRVKNPVSLGATHLEALLQLGNERHSQLFNKLTITGRPHEALQFCDLLIPDDTLELDLDGGFDNPPLSASKGVWLPRSKECLLRRELDLLRRVSTLNSLRTLNIAFCAHNYGDVTITSELLLPLTSLKNLTWLTISVTRLPLKKHPLPIDCDTWTEPAIDQFFTAFPLLECFQLCQRHTIPFRCLLKLGESSRGLKFCSIPVKMTLDCLHAAHVESPEPLFPSLQRLEVHWYENPGLRVDMGRFFGMLPKLKHIRCSYVPDPPHVIRYAIGRGKGSEKTTFEGPAGAEEDDWWFKWQVRREHGEAKQNRRA